MILRHEDVRRAAKDWKIFSSDAPFRVPISSEEAVRTMRQLPIETDPPEHTDYRKITDPFFQRPKDAAFIARVEALIDGMLLDALGRDSVEIVNEFALPIQSRALTYLLNVPESEADTWIGWGIHVFKVTGGEFKKGKVLEEYLCAQLDRAAVKPGEEFFRVFMPLTHIGRLCPKETNVNSVTVKAGGRISLSWASANLDENAFAAPREVRLDRKPNPHLTFGFGAHLCMGAAHARLILRTLLVKCTERIARIKLLKATERVEKEAGYNRPLGYEQLIVTLLPV